VAGAVAAQLGAQTGCRKYCSGAPNQPRSKKILLDIQGAGVYKANQ